MYNSAYNHQAYSTGCTYGLLWFTASDLCLIARQGAVAVHLVEHWLRIYSRALGSVVEHRLHTAGVSGSNPLAPTIFLPLSSHAGYWLLVLCAFGSGGMARGSYAWYLSSLQHCCRAVLKWRLVCEDVYSVERLVKSNRRKL